MRNLLSGVVGAVLITMVFPAINAGGNSNAIEMSGKVVNNCKEHVHHFIENDPRDLNDADLSIALLKLYPYYKEACPRFAAALDRYQQLLQRTFERKMLYTGSLLTLIERFGSCHLPYPWNDPTTAKSEWLRLLAAGNIQEIDTQRKLIASAALAC